MSNIFPSRTIAWYVARMFLVRTIAVLAALVIVLQALDLLSETARILAHPGNGQREILSYVGLRMPQIISKFLPFSVLLSTIITFVTLNSNSEVISMKAAGLSAHQILAPLLVASVGVAAFSFVFNDRIVSQSTLTLTRWQKNDFGEWPSDKMTFEDVWVRDGNNLVNAKSVTGAGTDTRLHDVTIYSRESNKLLAVLRAQTGMEKDGGWLLTNVKRFNVSDNVATPAPDLIVGKGIRADQFRLAAVDAEGYSFGRLWRAIDDLRAAGRPTTSLNSVLWHKLASPFSALLMPLLGAVAAFGIARSGKLFIRAVIGMALGFAYFVADNFGLAMGNMGAYPPLLAAWGPFFLFLLIGEAVLIKTEE